MCGIAGMAVHPPSVPSETTVKRMLASIAHRGPDAEGVYTGNNAVLGHRRLSVLDISEQGSQPMHHGELTIVFNGEIYNYVEVREQLIQLGHRFATGTDTEVILHGFEEWGEDCLHRFRGMWAFALLDGRNGRLFCSRDRFGIKPFYYAEEEGRFLFASEIKALLTAGVAPKADIDTLLLYLVVGYASHGEKTFFSGISQLLPGHNLTVDLYTGAIRMERYYTLLPGKGATDETYASAFLDSVKLHLRSDVPIGTCLSGGLDSSTLAAASSRLLQEEGPVSYIAVTAQSEAAYNDESGFARQVAEHCGLDWRLTRPTYEDFSAHVENCLRFHDEPVGGPSIFMQYWVMKTAKAAGLKVILDGQGGDETLLGYERYYPSYFCHLLAKGALVRLAKEYYLASKHSKLSLRQLTAYSLYFLVVPLRKRVLAKRARFVKRENVSRSLEIFGKLGKMPFHLDDLQRMELLQLQLPKLLQYEDRNSMAHSIEARVPFIDHICVETALSLPPESKIRDGYTKFALRRIADRLLPHSVAWRRNKFGFEAPSKVWLEKHLPCMQQKAEHSVLLRRICSRIPDLGSLSLDARWRLYNIAVWEEQYKVS
jgi:asparagine synthase (glutamine-hydrolysing)